MLRMYGLAGLTAVALGSPGAIAGPQTGSEAVFAELWTTQPTERAEDAPDLVALHRSVATADRQQASAIRVQKAAISAMARAGLVNERGRYVRTACGPSLCEIVAIYSEAPKSADMEILRFQTALASFNSSLPGDVTVAVTGGGRTDAPLAIVGYVGK